MANDKNLYTVLEASFRAAGDSAAFVVPSGRTVTYKALTDDVGRMANALVRLGVKHIRTKPYTPQTNGKAERFIQTALCEWAHATPPSSTQISAAKPCCLGYIATTGTGRG